MSYYLLQGSQSLRTMFDTLGLQDDLKDKCYNDQCLFNPIISKILDFILNFFLTYLCGLYTGKNYEIAF